MKFIEESVAGSVTLAVPPLELTKLQALFKKVSFVIRFSDLTASDKRFAFESVLLECEKSFMRVIGTDRRIIAIAKMGQGCPCKGRFIIPKPIVREIKRIKAAAGTPVTIGFQGKTIHFFIGGKINRTIEVPEHSGPPFLPYENFMGQKINTTVTADPKELRAMLNSIKDNSPWVEVVMALNRSTYVMRPFRIYSSNNNKKKWKEEYFPKAEWQGQDMKTKVNVDTLRGALKQVKGPVTLCFTTEIGPVYVKNADETFVAALKPYSPAEKR